MDLLEENDVVITGASGEFPRADNLEELSEKLFAKENLITSVPNMPCKLGKIKDLSRFDAEYFGFNQPHRVNIMDPMSRTIMEKAHEAIVDSGNNPVTFKGKNVGVFVGVHFLETEIQCYDKIQKGAILAICRSFLAQRISHWLGTHGPSFIVDSACSSTLLAFEMAYKAIKSGECESAFAGGCFVCLHPAPLVHLIKIGALNPTGESNVFDEKAGGFCKAETIGIFYLQKAKDAKRIYAKVINVRTNQDGSKPLFLSPHGPSQAKLLKTIYEESKVDIDSVSYIEAHATGTLVGDKQEVTALDQIFKNRKKPLLIGSVKSNMGHGESAAGVGSLSKVIIAMETGFIPPNINLTNLRKDVEAFAAGRIKVVTDKTPWNGGIVGVSCFGMGGGNTHAILQSFSKEKINGGIPDDDSSRIVGVSGRTEDAVQVLLNYLETSNLDAELVALLHEIHSFDIPKHVYRGYITLSKDKSRALRKIKNYKNSSRPLWFAFSNLENNTSVIYEALKNIEIFKNMIITCDEILKPLNVNVIEALENNKSATSALTAGLRSVIIQVALASLMTSLNLTPDNIICESFGGIVYAYLDGSFTLEQALKVAYYYSISNETSQKQNLKTILKKVIEPKSEIPSKWINASKKAKDENLTLIDYLASHLFNSEYVEDALKSISKDAIVVNFSSNKFLEIIKEYSKGESIVIAAVRNDSTTIFNDLITSLGELYLLGKNPYFQNLYPKVQFPVSRSTKMIAPLVKWKHDVQWPVAFSSLHERMLSAERKVSVSLDEKEHEYLSGHDIDSLNLYPGTGYLVLAWETLALMYGKMYPDLPVVFENIRFHKAVVLRKTEPTMFNITIQKGNKNFEIMENGELVASGRIYVTSNACKEMLTIVKPPEGNIILDKLDFYRFILIRNYNFKGAFRSIQKINIDGTKGSVAWNGNWVTYLDGILQLTMISQDHGGLRVPVEIEKVVIDTDKHRQILQSNSSELEVYRDPSMEIFQSGGVQIKNCVLRPIPWKLHDKVPLVQKYVFLPFILQEKKLPLKDVIQLFGQCLMDSIGTQTKNVKAVEILDNDFNSNYPPLTPMLLTFLKEQLFFRANLIVLKNDDIEFNKSGNEFDIINGKLPLGETVQLLICSQALKNPKKLESITNSLTDGGFLITREDCSSTTSIPLYLQVCSDVLCNGERLILLQKKSKLNLNSFKVIKVSSTSFDWINELQEALGIRSYERIILVSEKEPFSGILGFYNCLKLERGTEHVRCFFIRDEKIEHFSIENKFFKDQLLKDLAINIYKDETWGCYVRHAIDDLVPEKVHHAFVHRKYNGLKPSLQWCKGNIKTCNDGSDENLIEVFYAAVNHTDVLIYKNRLATEAVVEDRLKQDYAFGMEFSGRTRNGKRLMGLQPNGCLSTLIKINKDDLFFNEVPKNWRLEEAATVPLAYYTVIYALVVCGKLKNKDTVLIHAAGNFISQAAIHLVIHYNCNIFVTISSVDEKLFIKENFPYISDSKIGYTDSSFEQMISKETNGRGVDIILNSLTEEKMSTSVNCLARYGRFVQMKNGDLSNINSYGNKLLSKNASLHSAVLKDIFNLPKENKIELKNLVDEHIQDGAIKLLTRTMYCYTGIESAFEFASSPRNLNKCIIQIKSEEDERCAKTQTKLSPAYPRTIFNSEKSYIVCGGLGGMGMELVNWMISRDARKIIITSRKGVSNGSQALFIKRWQSFGAQITISKADITDREQTVELLEKANSLGHVGGIFNLAAVLKDKMFKNQTAENFRISAGPKLFGTYNLDTFSRLKCPALEHFVVFSSTACGYGNLGQTNYGMSNSAIERICEQRKADGLPALAIEWGAVGNVGMFVSFMDGNTESSYAGGHMQPIKSCLEVLDYCMNQPSPIVVSCLVAKK